MNLTEKSKYMAMLLRHKPEKGNITIDTQGYTDVNSLINSDIHIMRMVLKLEPIKVIVYLM